MIWLLVLYVWTFCSMLVGCVVGLSIRLADRREQPDLDADTAEIYVPRWDVRA